MLKSKTTLPDINIWVALVSERHMHHNLAREWFAALPSDSAAFCRVSQMGLLRLLTNSRVMGEDTVTQQQAWQVYEQLRRNSRVVLGAEPAEFEETWKRLTQAGFPGKDRWTDAYLGAFALRHDLVLVTFDRDFGTMENLRVMILGGSS